MTSSSPTVFTLYPNIRHAFPISMVVIRIALHIINTRSISLWNGKYPLFLTRLARLFLARPIVQSRHCSLKALTYRMRRQVPREPPSFMQCVAHFTVQGSRSHLRAIKSRRLCVLHVRSAIKTFIPREPVATYKSIAPTAIAPPTISSRLPDRFSTETFRQHECYARCQVGWHYPKQV